jgi:hypothetical protein
MLYFRYSYTYCNHLFLGRRGCRGSTFVCVRKTVWVLVATHHAPAFMAAHCVVIVSLAFPNEHGVNHSTITVHSSIACLTLASVMVALMNTPVVVCRTVLRSPDGTHLRIARNRVPSASAFSMCENVWVGASLRQHHELSVPVSKQRTLCPPTGELVRRAIEPHVEPVGSQWTGRPRADSNRVTIGI